MQQLTFLQLSIPELKWVANPVIRTQKGQQREIDIILSLNQKIYIIEVTTSHWQKKATQLISLANQLQIPIKQCMILSPGSDSELMREFSNLHGCNVLSFEQF